MRVTKEIDYPLLWLPTFHVGCVGRVMTEIDAAFLISNHGSILHINNTFFVLV